MLNLLRYPVKHYLTIIFILFITHSFSQEVEWAYSNDYRRGDGAKNLKQVPEGLILLTSRNLQKWDESGNQLWRFDFFDLDDYQYSSAPNLIDITTDEIGNTYALMDFPGNGAGPTTISNIDIPHGISVIKINSDGELLWSRKLTGSKRTFIQYHQITFIKI